MTRSSSEIAGTDLVRRDQSLSSARSSAAALAALINRSANRASAVRRSDVLTIQSLTESSAMLSWRGAIGVGAGVGWR
jgi:hypothetical protein